MRDEWMRARSLALLLVAVCSISAEPFQPVFRFPEGRVGDKAELVYRNGLPVLVVRGTPEEVGTAVGSLAVKNAPRALRYPRQLLKYFGADGAWGLFVRAGNGMVKHFPRDYRAELEALAKASGADRDTIVAGNTLFDLKKMFSCSAVLVDGDRSVTGGPLLGRNLDHLSLGYIHQYTLVTIYKPTGKHAFATVGFPGLIGCLSGMNDAGLAVAILEVFDVKDGEAHFDIEGTPYALCYRKILEECTSIDEAKRLLDGMRRTTTTNLVLADRKSVAVFEVSPGRVERRDARQGVAACTNHYCTAALKPAKPLDLNYSSARFRILERLRLAEARLTPDDLRRQLDAANLGEMTLQTMVFDTSGLKLHLSAGATPASKVALKSLDLGPLFKDGSGPPTARSQP